MKVKINHIDGGAEYVPPSICFLTGNGSGSGSQQQSTQGFADLPPEIQNVFKSLATTAGNYIGQPSTSSMFTATQSPLTTQANTAIGQGFTPTASSIQSNIAAQQNPYDKYVIDEINRQAQGQNSVLQQNLNSAGQFGSNRGFLGANDIDLSRMNNIGSFLQGNYNTDLQNALTTIPQAQAATAAAQLQAGQQQQQFGLQQQQAPISSLGAISSILGVLPTNSGQSSGTSNSSSFGFGFGFPKQS